MPRHRISSPIPVTELHQDLEDVNELEKNQGEPKGSGGGSWDVMAAPNRLNTSRRLICSLCQTQRITAPSHLLNPRRNASSTASAPDKPIVLEQPDKFRPPSHPQKLVRGRARPNTFGGSYNQESTPREKEAQRTKRYPHTFPNEGTVMHKFLTNKWWHFWITMVRTSNSCYQPPLTQAEHTNISCHNLHPSDLSRHITLLTPVTSHVQPRLPSVFLR